MKSIQVATAAALVVLVQAQSNDASPANGCTEIYGDNLAGTGAGRTNYYRCSSDPLRDQHLLFVPYEASYLGSLSMTYTNPELPCAPPTFGVYDKALFALGGVVLPSDTSITRAPWDSNPFYFYMDGDGPDMSNATTGFDVQFESSTSTYVYGQAWTLSSVKEGEGFRLTGTLTTEYVNDINRYTDYLPCADAAGQPLKTYAGYMTTTSNARMNGLVTAGSASIEWVIEGYAGGGTRTYRFEGSWDSGSRLVTTAQQIELDATSVDPEPQEGAAVGLRAPWWAMAIGSLGLGLLVI